MDEEALAGRSIEKHHGFHYNKAMDETYFRDPKRPCPSFSCTALFSED